MICSRIPPKTETRITPDSRSCGNPIGTALTLSSRLSCSDDWNDRHGAVSKPSERYLGRRNAHFFCDGLSLIHI